MPDGDLLILTSSGDALMNEAGDLMLERAGADPCCQGPQAIPCKTCSDFGYSTPLTLGISYIPPEDQCVGHYLYHWEGGSSHILYQVEACLWSGSDPETGYRVTYYSDDGCTGSSGTSTFYGVAWRVVLYTDPSSGFRRIQVIGFSYTAESLGDMRFVGTCSGPWSVTMHDHPPYTPLFGPAVVTVFAL